MKSAQDDNTLYYENLGNDFDRYMSDYDVSQRVKLIFKLMLCYLREL